METSWILGDEYENLASNKLKLLALVITVGH